MALLRPHQWLKNLLLLFPPFFGGQILDVHVLKAIIPALIAFSCAASCAYILNDIKDKDSDKNHPEKKDRAIARGHVTVTLAFILAALFYLAAILVASTLSARFEGYIILYLFVSLFYTLFFKQIIGADILFVSLGFVIRVAAGGEAFHIVVSNWLLSSVFMVSLVLAAGKRLGELVTLGDNASDHRNVLSRYSQVILKKFLWFSASGALITYTLYILERRNTLFPTILLAAYGFIRYIYIVAQGKGDPTDALLKDRHIFIIGIIWAASIGIIIYT